MSGQPEKPNSPDTPQSAESTPPTDPALRGTTPAGQGEADDGTQAGVGGAGVGLRDLDKGGTGSTTGGTSQGGQP